MQISNPIIRCLIANNVSNKPRPLRLEIPANGFQSQEHLGHIIRPVSPNSPHLSRRSSLHIDSYFPRTTSTNGSISSRLYRHAMSPRVGIRTSLFSAIEVRKDRCYSREIEYWLIMLITH
jgi:hypothetical protein